MKFFYTKKFVKKFAKYNPPLQKQIHQTIINIPKGNISIIVGKNTPKTYRLRIAKYRIIFYYKDPTTVYISMIDSRGDVYKKI